MIAGVVGYLFGASSASNGTFGKFNHRADLRSQLLQHPLQCGPSMCTRVAGLSGGFAVVMAAYGAHFIFANPDINDERKRVMEHANRHHFLNTIGIALGSVCARYPLLTSSLFALGTLLFCVPSYAFAIRCNRALRALTPYGGVLAMLGWFSFIL